MMQDIRKLIFLENSPSYCFAEILEKVINDTTLQI